MPNSINIRLCQNCIYVSLQFLDKMNSRVVLSVVLLLFTVFSACRANRGVSAWRISSEANNNVDSESWSKDGCRRFRFCGSWKCNLFVHDILSSVNAVVPKRSSWYYSPIGANEWGNPYSSYVSNTRCFNLVNDFDDKERGDVIAFPQNSGSGHVGIVYSSTEYISARQYIVNKTGYPSTTRTIWRYRYDDPNC